MPLQDERVRKMHGRDLFGEPLPHLSALDETHAQLEQYVRGSRDPSPALPPPAAKAMSTPACNTTGGLASRLLDANLEDGDMRGPLSGMFPASLPVPTFATALAPICNQLPSVKPDGQLAKMAWRKAGQVESRFPSLNRDECAAIVLYTLEDMPREQSPYYVMNAALRDKNRHAMGPWRDFVWLLLHALRKLSPSQARVVVRGCTGTPAQLGVSLAAGTELQWSAFSSTATKVEVMEVFLGSRSGAPEPRTMFQLELMEPIGRDISAFSLHPQECELLLPPNVCFEVVSHYETGSGLVMVQCKQTDSYDALLDFGCRPGVPMGRPVNEVPMGLPADVGEDLQSKMDTLQAQREREVSQLIELGAHTRDVAVDLLRLHGSLEVATNALRAAADCSLANVQKLVDQLHGGAVWQQSFAASALTMLAFNHDDNKVAIARAGGIAPLVALARGGSEEQKECAVLALAGLSANNADNAAAIARAGGIAPVVAVALAGTVGQKEKATVALAYLSANNADNAAAIARAGGIAPLVALARGGMDEQKECAVLALAFLAANADNKVAIARAGGIAPLVALALAGTAGQKEWAARALAFLADNDDNKVAIARAGGIAPLVALARDGTDGQKEAAAEALGSLSANNADNAAAIARAGGIAPLVALARGGTDGQKRRATLAL